MESKFFLHQIRSKIQDGVKVYDKGIVVKDSLDEAKQSFHAYLGAYAYGNAADCDYVSCHITNSAGSIVVPPEVWVKAQS